MNKEVKVSKGQKQIVQRRGAGGVVQGHKSYRGGKLESRAMGVARSQEVRV